MNDEDSPNGGIGDSGFRKKVHKKSLLASRDIEDAIQAFLNCWVWGGLHDK